VKIALPGYREGLFSYYPIVNHRVNHAIRFINFYRIFSVKSGFRRGYGFCVKKYPKTTIFSDFGVLGAEGGI
jgi:hypothetical protein